jgi:signal transduction histidine kinase
MNLVRTLALVRLVVFVMGATYLGLRWDAVHGGYRALGLAVVLAHLAVGVVLVELAWKRRVRARHLARAGVVVDLLLVMGYVLTYAFEDTQPLRSLLYLVVLEAALLFRMRGGLVTALATVPVLAAAEVLHAAELDTDAQPESVVLRGVVALLLGGITGRLVELERRQAKASEQRAAEAERLRDAFGRRVDLLEAANRCARALGSSLRLDEAFDAFVEEIGGVVAFDRLLVARSEDGVAEVLATAGLGADEWPPGATQPHMGVVVDRLRDGRTYVRGDLTVDTQPGEEPLVERGLRSQVVAPLSTGGQTIGYFTLARRLPDAFSPEEVELIALLGRLVGSAVQNIRAYEAERTTVEELRRLSALRADFVSLVSHELRSPMAAVIGSARTLQERWRELRPDQREAFLAVIADETSRLARLIEDVLHTSRIEAGTFTYRFSEVDLVHLAREAVAAAEIAQDEVRLAIDVASALPTVHGDPERLRQLLDNLVSNAVKYSAAGQEVRVSLGGDNGRVRLAVRDNGPGIAPEHQTLIFEKFGRAATGGAKPGTGLGLFIARSIAQAHGGSLDVQSALGRGTTFTLTLPV